jgi:hypothetical protein
MKLKKALLGISLAVGITLPAQSSLIYTLDLTTDSNPGETYVSLVSGTTSITFASYTGPVETDLNDGSVEYGDLNNGNTAYSFAFDLESMSPGEFTLTIGDNFGVDGLDAFGNDPQGSFAFRDNNNNLLFATTNAGGTVPVNFGTEASFTFKTVAQEVAEPAVLGLFLLSISGIAVAQRRRAKKVLPAVGVCSL